MNFADLITAPVSGFTGMLWMNDYPNLPLAFNIAAALEYFTRKYQVIPTVCYVAPEQFNGDEINGLRIAPLYSVPKDFVLIGLDGAVALNAVRPQAPTSTEGAAA